SRPPWADVLLSSRCVPSPLLDRPSDADRVRSSGVRIAGDRGVGSTGEPGHGTDAAWWRGPGEGCSPNELAGGSDAAADGSSPRGPLPSDLRRKTGATGGAGGGRPPARA